MRTYLKLAAWLPVIFLVGCADTAAPSKPTAAAPKPEPAAPSAATALEADSIKVPANALAISPRNAKITWVGTKPEGKHDGGFGQFSGYVEKGPSGIAGGKV